VAWGHCEAWLTRVHRSHGLAPGNLSPDVNVTVFPHAIALAATFDTDLVRRVSEATAVEGRIVNQLNYATRGGRTWQAVSCDGGPLANTMTAPTWGRNSETYGECPSLSAIIGVQATRSLQNRTVVNGNVWLQLSQVTRHYLGYHGASPGG